MSFHFNEFTAPGGRPRPSLAVIFDQGYWYAHTADGPCGRAKDCIWRARRGPSACSGCALGVASPYIETLESVGSSSPLIDQSRT